MPYFFPLLSSKGLLCDALGVSPLLARVSTIGAGVCFEALTPSMPKPIPTFQATLQELSMNILPLWVFPPVKIPEKLPLFQTTKSHPRPFPNS